MSLAALLAEAREAGRLERLYRSLRREVSWRENGLGEFFASALAWIIAGPIWCLVPVVPPILEGRRIAHLGVFEALRMPSRSGLLTARWTRSLLFFAWHGLYLALWLVVLRRKLFESWTTGTFLVLSAVSLTPLAVGQAMAFKALQDGQPLLPGAAGLPGRVLRTLFGIWMGALFLLLYPLDPLRLFRIDPAAFRQSLFGSWLLPLAPLELILVLLATGMYFRWQLRAVERCEIPTYGRARSSPAPAASPVPRQRVIDVPRVGKGLWWAEFERFRSGLSAGWLNRGLASLFLARGPILAVLAVLLAERPVALVLALASGLLASKVFGNWECALESDQRMRYLLGVDLRDQVLFDLKTLLWFAAVPTVASAFLAALLGGMTGPQFGIALFITAFFLLRAGWGGCLLAFLASVLMVVLLVLQPTLSLAALLQTAAGVGAVGFLGIFRRLRGLREEDLRAAMRRREERRRQRA